MDSTLSDLLIENAKGIGRQRAKLFGSIGIRTVVESLYYLPYRYEDRSRLSHICELREGWSGTIRGSIVSACLKGPRGKGRRIFEVLVNDGTGIVKGRWFNQAFMEKNLMAGQEVLLSGKAKRDPYSKAALVIDGPEYETAVGDGDSPPVHTNRVVPVYRITEGISQKQFRKIMLGIVEDYAGDIADPMPPEIVERNGLPPLRESIQELHFPGNKYDADLWNRRKSVYHRRLAFDELFTFEIGMAVLKMGKDLDKGTVLRGKGILLKKLRDNLRFGLTSAQERVLKEILSDMGRPFPMHRLLQGDVGCGKTVVALGAMLNAVECGFQTAFMAPTEILAEQHYRTLSSMTDGLGLKMVLVTGGARERQLDLIASGEISIIVGTHALIQDCVVFRNLGLIVIDEQHKFGVIQRGSLRKKGINPDMLVMTATPIPRSLALTLYGDLDYSVIDEMPAGRRPAVTKVFTSDRKAEIYAILEREINKGRQAYVVYPAIEESESIDLKSALQGAAGFRRHFPQFGIGLLHGRMSTQDKDMTMASFKRGEIDILVSTTVVEVGMDVPNATVMLIVHAERFGLAQLHQLRGRVGRGNDASYCLLVAYGPAGEDAGRRLDVMAGTSDGFRIAEEDLEIRGPGEFFGTKQAGMPDLKVADPVRDVKILEIAKKEAFDLIDANPGLKKFPLLRKSCEEFWQGRIAFYKTG